MNAVITRIGRSYDWLGALAIYALTSNKSIEIYIQFIFHLGFFLQNGVSIEIVRVLPESPSPNLSNIFCNSTDVNPSEMVRILNTNHGIDNSTPIIFVVSQLLLLLFSVCVQTITLDCDATPVFQIKTHRLRAGKLETSHYKVTISRFRARLSIKISYNTLKGEMTIEGYPDVSTPSTLHRDSHHYFHHIIVH